MNKFFITAVNSILQLGKGGIKLLSIGTINKSLKITESDGSTIVPIQIADPTENEHAVTKKFLNLNLGEIGILNATTINDTPVSMLDINNEEGISLQNDGVYRIDVAVVALAVDNSSFWATPPIGKTFYLMKSGIVWTNYSSMTNIPRAWTGMSTDIAVTPSLDEINNKLKFTVVGLATEEWKFKLYYKIVKLNN